MQEQRLSEILPDPEVALALPVEELAGAVLQWLNTTGGEFKKLDDYVHNVNKDYIPRYRQRMGQAMFEACAWLAREGFIVHHPANYGHVFISRRGAAMKNATDVVAYRNADILPRRILHPVIEQKVYGLFVRGDYDIAVLQALKEVEVAVRAAGNFAASDIGVALMRKAFAVGIGPLTNSAVVTAEQQGESDLFAGAIATYRNSIGHRPVKLDADTAVELILLASHLLKIVDSRTAAPPPSSP